MTCLGRAGLREAPLEGEAAGEEEEVPAASAFGMALVTGDGPLEEDVGFDRAAVALGFESSP